MENINEQRSWPEFEGKWIQVSFFVDFFAKLCDKK